MHHCRSLRIASCARARCKGDFPLASVRRAAPRRVCVALFVCIGCCGHSIASCGTMYVASDHVSAIGRAASAAAIYWYLGDHDAAAAADRVPRPDEVVGRCDPRGRAARCRPVALPLQPVGTHPKSHPHSARVHLNAHTRVAVACVRVRVRDRAGAHACTCRWRSRNDAAAFARYDLDRCSGRL